MAKQNIQAKDYESFKETLNNPIDYGKYNKIAAISNSIGANNQIVLQSTLKKQQEEYNPVEYDTPNEAIFHRYSDGTYQAKFKNYLGATGNEDRLGQQQSAFEQVGYGLVKNVRKMGNYVLDATIGTVAGIANSISEGSLSGFWNNDVSRTIDDWNQSLDYKLPNYYTNEQRSMSVLRSLGTANFWANDVAGGLAFVGGALIPEVALGVMTGGATFSGSLAKVGLKSAGKNLAKKGLKEGVEEFLDPTNYTSLSKPKFGAAKQSFNTEKLIQSAQKAKELEGGLDLMKAAQKVKRYAAAGNALDMGLFVTRTSGFEAGMEARHNFNESIENYIANFEAQQGRVPTAEEIANFTNDAVNVANGVFGVNMAILSVSNYAMFGKALGIKNIKLGANTFENIRYSAKNTLNSTIGLGIKQSTEDAAKLTLKGANRAQKIVGSTYKTFSKPLIEGVYEEGLQGVAGKTMQNYLEGKYSTDKDATLDFTSSLYKAFGEQYGTKEGWKEMTVGMLIGLAGGPITERSYKAMPGLGNNSRKAAQEALGKDVDKVNKGVDMLRNMNRASSAANFRSEFENRASNNKRSSFEESNINMAFIQSQESLKSTKAIQNDFNKIIDESTFEELGFANDEEVITYKENLKSEFAKDVSHYKSAKSLVDNLNLTSLKLGEKYEVKDYMTALFFNAGKSTERAKSIAQDIDNITGENGLYNSLTLLASFNKEQLDIVDKLNQNKTKVQELRDLAVKYSTDFSAEQTDRTRSEKYKEYAQKVAITQKRILELEDENKKLSSAIEGINNLQTDFEFGDTITAAGNIDTLQAVEQVSRMESYVDKLLKAGRYKEAKHLDTLLDDFKTNVGTTLQASIEASKIVSGAYDTTRKNGKTGVLQGWRSLLGPEYKMTEETKNQFREKEDVLRKSFNSVFTQAPFDLEEQLAHLENTPDLSSREKYKIENSIKMLLALESLEEINSNAAKSLIDISKKREVVTIEKAVPGSTVFIKRAGSEVFETGTVTENQTILTENEEEITFDQVEEAEAYAKEEPTNQKIKAQEIEEKRFKSLSSTSSQSSKNKINSEFDKRYLELLTKGEITPKAALESLYLNNRQNSKVFKKIQKDSGILFNNKFIDVVDGITISENLDITNSKTLEDTINNILGAIERIRKGDQNSSEVENLQQEIENLKVIALDLKTDPDQADLLKDTEDLIKEKEEELKTKSYSPVSIIETDDFKRFAELSTKDELQRTPEEKEEYAQLKAEIDDWTLISGITISGVNLSDLIEQKAFLDTTQTEQLPDIEQPVFKEILGAVNAADREQKSNYTYGLGYYSALASKNTDGTHTVYYVNPETFLQEIGVRIFTKDGNTYLFDLEGEPFSLTRDRLGNLTIEDTLVEAINKNTNIKILSTFDGNYSVVYKFNSESIGTPLQSTFNNEYNKENQIASEEVVYRTQEGEDMFLEFDPLDDYNKPLLDAFKKAVDPAQKEEAKINIQNSGVIRIVNKKGETIQILKGNRSQEGDRLSDEDLRFIAMRVEALENENLISKAATTKTIQSLPVTGIKVKKVLIGHPTLSVEQEQDNLSVATSFRPIRKEDTKKVLDIGYIEEGGIYLRNKVEASTQMITKIREKSEYTKGKTPVVVLSKYGKNFIYPVRTVSIEPKNVELFSDTFNSENIENTQKAIKLNKILLENGVDINVKGNAFVAIGANNLTEEFFNEKLNQILNTERYEDVSKWLDKTNNYENIVTQEILLNLNINDPIHSPKIEFDFSGVNLKGSPVATVAKNLKAVDENTPKSTAKVSRLKVYADKVNKKIIDELDKDC